MRYAVLSDIHANLAALDAILGTLRKDEVEALVLLGDYVGYYYEPGEVIDRLREWPHHAIRGNHDRLLLEAREDVTVAERYRERYGSGVDVALGELSSAAWQWLEALPERLTVELGSFTIELCHGAPFDPDAYVYPDAGPDIFARCRLAGRDAVWMGHTHWPFLKPGSPWLLNPGSVGQPRDLGGMASWCLFDGDTGAVAFRRTDFATEGLWHEVVRRDPGLERNRTVLRQRRLEFPR